MESEEDTIAKNFEESWEKNSTSFRNSNFKYFYESSMIDFQVQLLPRKKRTAAHVHPMEPMGQLPLQIKELIHFYTSDYVIVQQSTRAKQRESIDKDEVEERNKRHEYEINIPEGNFSTKKIKCVSMSPSTTWESPKILNVEHDNLLLALLQSHPPRIIDKTNEKMRSDGHQDTLFNLFPMPSADSIKFCRIEPKIPEESTNSRILVECHQLKLDLEVEPIFASMALYDVNLKRKISENFHFDMNPEGLKKMLPSYDSNIIDPSTMGQYGIFRISNPTSGLYLVIRLEKVLQGDIDKCMKPYLKHSKNTEKLKEKIANNCWRLGKYRMPFAWTAINVKDIISGSKIIDVPTRGSTIGPRTSSGYSSDSGKRTSMIGGKLNTPWTKNLDNFKPVTIAVPCFIKQDMDYVSDNALMGLIRQISLKKKFEVIPGTLQLRISPCPTEIKGCLSPELVPINPIIGEQCNPIRELLEFPSKEPGEPYQSYRNLLYIYPKSFSPASRQGPFRNITIKVELFEVDQKSSMCVIYGKSSGPKLISRTYTVVSYHKKHPEFYDEIKINVPSQFNKKYLLVFEFFHLNCSKKSELSVETRFGISWLPLFYDGNLRAGEFDLPVIQEENLSIDHLEYPIVRPTGKGMDYQKGTFKVHLKAVSSVHPEDQHVGLFLNNCSVLQEIYFPKEGEKTDCNTELIFSIVQLPEADTRYLIKFLPTILNKIIWLIINASKHQHTQEKVGRSAFKTLVQIINKVTLHSSCTFTADKYRQDPLLVSYVHYQSHIPHPNHNFNIRMNNLLTMQETQDKQDGKRNHGHSKTKEVYSNRNSNANVGQSKLLYEELLFHLNNSDNYTKELALNSIWFIFDLIMKSMIEDMHWKDQLNVPRRKRFSEAFKNSISTFLEWILLSIHQRPISEEIGLQLIVSVAHFLNDLLSVMDRGWVLQSIKNFSYKIPADLQIFKLDFLYVICQNDQFIPLNLFATPSATMGLLKARDIYNKSASNQQSNWSNFETFFEVSANFRKNHFLAGLLLNCFQSSLSSDSTALREKAIRGLHNLLNTIDRDLRYQKMKDKMIIASLFSPIVGITMRTLPQIQAQRPSYSGETVKGKTDENRRPGSGDIQEGFTMNLSKSSFFLPVDRERYSRSKENLSYLSINETMSLLLCFLWVLKHVDKDILRLSLSELPPKRIGQFLELLVISMNWFEYKEKKRPVYRKVYSTSLNNISDLPSFPEESIISKGLFSSSIGNTSIMDHIDSPTKNDNEVDRDGDLAAEISLIALDCIEMLIEVLPGTRNENMSMEMVIKTLLESLGKNQSIAVLACLFSTQRSLVTKFPHLLFDDESELCKDLCLHLLRHCSSILSGIRSQASLSIYLLMRQSFQTDHNFSWVKLQLTVAMSTLVATYTKIREDSIHKSLQNIIKYSEADTQYSDTSLPIQVKELIFSLHIILSDTIKIKEAQPDLEMLFCLMHRIANAHKNSPNLRLTWLINMAHKYTENGSNAEAAMCMVHCAALVAEYLSLYPEKPYLPKGAVAFENLSPNVLEESILHEDRLIVEEGGLGKYFTEGGLVGLLEQAAAAFNAEKLYEATNEVYKIVIPIAEAKKYYKKLANIHSKLHDAFTLIEANQRKRVFGTYYRVSFYGEKFGELNECEFIYKEPCLTKLNEIFIRLKTFYEDKFGATNVIIIKDSNAVNKSELEPNKLYIQITYVEPYFDMYELQSRVTAFERNFNIRKFMYATPFTPHGHPHGNIAEQWKRKTFLTTSHHFPYIQRRLLIVEKDEVVLTPIEVAIEDIQNKTIELKETISYEPPDAKLLQMVLQGCIGTTVNQGPREVAVVFLSNLFNENAKPTKFQNKLRLCFKDFSKQCYDGLRKNEKIISPEQTSYQHELEKNFWRFIDYLEPLIQIKNSLKNESYVYLRKQLSTDC